MKPACESASRRPKPCASLEKPHESCPFAFATVLVNLNGDYVRAQHKRGFLPDMILLIAVDPMLLPLGNPIKSPFKSFCSIKSQPMFPPTRKGFDNFPP